MTKLIFIGGFLGAGKTTLICQITRMLKDRGLKVGIITNDQAADLVDTSLLEHISVKVAEVSGSCFCCDFKGLRKAIEHLGENEKPDIILAEPVGSCTDLSATLIKPMKEIMNTEISVSPLTVLADPGRLKDVIDESSNIHPGAAYIIKKQLEESDIIALTKSDLYTDVEIMSLQSKLKQGFPECEVRIISSENGSGVAEWLDYVLSSDDAGRHIVEVDYDKYAEGEAVLGWLNCSASLSGKNVDWDAFTLKFMKDLASRFDAGNLHVGHVKILIENGDRYISANITGKAGSLSSRWSAGSGNNAEMIVNARVEMSPSDLENLFLESLRISASDSIQTTIRRIRCISPGYPNPTYRYRKN